MNCTRCGQENENGDHLCQTCGEAMGSGEVKAIRGRDVFGFILGGPLLLLVIWQICWLCDAVSERDDTGISLSYLLAGASVTAIVALVPACLLVPTRHYERAFVRILGFIALTVSIALAACCVAVSGFGAFVFLSDPAADFAAIGILFAIAGAIGCVHLLLGACVMLFKLRPRPAHAATWVAAGGVVGAVGAGLPVAVLGFLLALGCIMHGIHIADDALSAWVPSIGGGLLIGAIFGSALGAWLVRRAVGQKGSFRIALLGALLGSIVPLIGTVIGAVIGSGWRAKGKPIDEERAQK